MSMVILHQMGYFSLKNAVEYIIGYETTNVESKIKFP
jgi:hypothetical protein